MRRIVFSSLLPSLALALLVFGSSNCTLVSNFTECKVDADCAQAHGPRATCEDQVCVTPSNITGATCTETFGTVDSPRGLVIGVLLPLSGIEEGFGRPLLNAIKLAWGNFNQIGGIGDRPIGLLICDTEGDDAVALAAAKHAVEVGKVTAIIGPDFSSQTIAVATQVAIPNGVLLVTPSGTAAAITDLDETNPNPRDLIWRTAPSDAAQAEAIVALVEHQVTTVMEQTLDEPVVWLLTRANDAYSAGLQLGLIDGFPPTLTNSDNFHPRVYPDDWSDSWFTENALNLPAPDVVLVMGAGESWDIAEAIDDAFDSEPIFIFPDAARNESKAQTTSAALHGRVLGTAPRNVGDPSYSPYTTFRVKYLSEFDDDPNRFQFVANAYDALHVIALGVAGGGGVSGVEISNGMKMLSSGQAISANSQDAQKGILLLSRGTSVDFEGASGRLDFDDRGDPSPSSIALWCFDASGVPEVGDLLTTTGKFTPLTCGEAEPEPDGGDDVDDVGGAEDGDAGSDAGDHDAGFDDADAGSDVAF